VHFDQHIIPHTNISKFKTLHCCNKCTSNMAAFTTQHRMTSLSHCVYLLMSCSVMSLLWELTWWDGISKSSTSRWWPQSVVAGSLSRNLPRNDCSWQSFSVCARLPGSIRRLIVTCTPIFKLPRVRTTRFKSSFINYAVDHYVWSRLILKCLIIVSCRCSNKRVNVFIYSTIYICEYFVFLHFHVYFAIQP